MHYNSRQDLSVIVVCLVRCCRTQQYLHLPYLKWHAVQVKHRFAHTIMHVTPS